MIEKTVFFTILIILIVLIAMIVRVILSMIAANYAKKKGYSKAVFVCISLFLSPIIALIVALVCEDRTMKEEMNNSLKHISSQSNIQSSAYDTNNQTDKAEELQRFYALYQQGAITQEEYEKQKKHILRK